MAFNSFLCQGIFKFNRFLIFALFLTLLFYFKIFFLKEYHYFHQSVKQIGASLLNGSMFCAQSGPNCMGLKDCFDHKKVKIVEGITEKIFFLFLNPIIHYGYSKELSQCDGQKNCLNEMVFLRIQNILKIMGKKLFTI